MSDIHSEVEQVLNSGAENVAFEEIPEILPDKFNGGIQLLAEISLSK